MFLSRVGILTLILVVLNDLPMYFMSLFRISRSVTEGMEKIMRDFLWDGPYGNHHCRLVDWDQVCRPKERGG